MKKIIIMVSICLVAVLLIGGLLYFKSSKTLDFRGTVTEIKNENGTYTFYIEQASISVKYTVIADSTTKILKDDAEISVADVKVGDTIEGDYKKWFAEENKAKHIKVWVESAT